MNKKEFAEKLDKELRSGNKFNISDMSKWYYQILEQLEHSYFKTSTIKHPRHRGDSREYDLVEILSKMLPERIKIAKGYGYDRFSGITFEQDCIFYDSLNYAPLMKTSEIAYLPIESIYSSIEVKSNLTKDELRKCILNCLNSKKLTRTFDQKFKETPRDLKKIEEKNKIIYSIFCYNCPHTLENLVTILEELNSEIPTDLQINMIYILNKGLIVPARMDNSLSLNFNDILNHKGKYVPVTKLSKRDDNEFKILPFLLFISYIIDHFNEMSNSRKVVSYARYVFDPIILQQNIDDLVEKNKKNENSNNKEIF